MPLTQPQIDGILLLLNGNGDPNANALNPLVNKIIDAREDLLALIRIHANISNADIATIITGVKTRINTAAAAIVTLST